MYHLNFLSSSKAEQYSVSCAAYRVAASKEDDCLNIAVEVVLGQAAHFFQIGDGEEFCICYVSQNGNTVDTIIHRKD